MTQTNCGHIKEMYKDGKCMWCGASSTEENNMQQFLKEECEVLADNVDRYFDSKFIQEVEALVRKETIEEIIKMIPEHQKPITSKKYTEIKKDNPHVPNIQFFLGENIGRNGFRQSMYIVLRKYAQSKGITL